MSNRPAPRSASSKKGGKPSERPPPTAVAPPPFDKKKLALRVAIPVAIAWVIPWVIPAGTTRTIVLIVVAVLTVAVLGAVGFAFNYMAKGRRVQSIVTDAKTKEERKEAIEKLDKEFKKGDSAAIFAKAQLLMQEDPRAALVELEKIDLGKVMPNVADEARAQRAMLHLMLGEPQEARPLADKIDLSRQQDQKSKAMMASVVCEAWARTGQAKKAKDILDLFDADDATIADARAGLLRAQVFTFGATNDVKKARHAMHKLAKVDPRIVAGFAQKGVHPLIVQEAKKILEKSGAIQRVNVRGPMRG